MRITLRTANGLPMIDTTRPILADFTTEVLGAVTPKGEHHGDVDFGWPLLQQMSGLGIGHAMVVRERDVIAVEATEATATLIERAGRLCRRTGWALLKTCGDGRESDSVGVETIDALARAGGGCLAIAVDRVPFADKAAVLAAADRARIAVVAVREEEAPGSASAG